MGPACYCGAQLSRTIVRFRGAGVPQVSAEHRQARREQILAAARRCFARNGFHQTSMDDLLAEAALSAGGLYRYFRGKDEIIAAIAQEVIGSIGAEVAGIVGEKPAPPLPEALRRILTIIDRHAGPGGTAGLAVQVWGEAQRDPALADLVRHSYQTLREHTTTLAHSAAAAGDLPADAAMAAVGQVLFALLPGYLLQKLTLGDVDVQTYLDGFTALTTPTPITPTPITPSPSSPANTEASGRR